jgi:hypothetical protein
VCYAFGRDEDEMQPHEAVEEKESEECSSCPQNEWGSANEGRGKACKNRRRLAVIPAGTFNKAGEFEAFDEDAAFSKASIAYLNLPVTSVNGYGAYIKQLSGALRRPPHAVFTRIALVPDEKSQFKVVFELIEAAPDAIIPILIQRNKETKELIEFPYAKVDDRQQAPAKKGRQAAAPPQRSLKRNSKY